MIGPSCRLCGPVRRAPRLRSVSSGAFGLISSPLLTSPLTSPTGAAGAGGVSGVFLSHPTVKETNTASANTTERPMTNLPTSAQSEFGYIDGSVARSLSESKLEFASEPNPTAQGQL